MRLGGIILAGGHSRRMGIDKATLAFGDETLVERMVRILGDVAAPVAVVAAARQSLPLLPKHTLIARDERPDRGPLEAFSTGLRAIGQVEMVFLCACDMPLLTAKFVKHLAAKLDPEHDAVLPVVDGNSQPLAAVYRSKVRSQVDELLRLGRSRMLDLTATLRTRKLTSDELAPVDPRKVCLSNLNTPADYRNALVRAGL